MSSEDGLTDIVVTDATGKIIGHDDTDDWQPRPEAPGFSFGPASPNPVRSDTVFLGYSIPGTTQVRLEIIHRTISSDVVRVLVDETQGAGFFQVVWDTRDELGQAVAEGIYRASIVATTNDTTYRSYGDIMVDR